MEEILRGVVGIEAHSLREHFDRFIRWPCFHQVCSQASQGLSVGGIEGHAFFAFNLGLVVFPKELIGRRNEHVCP